MRTDFEKDARDSSVRTPKLAVISQENRGMCLARPLARRAGQFACAPTGALTIVAEPAGYMSLRRIAPRNAVLVSVLALTAAAPLVAGARDDARKQVEFGMTVAARGLWREAIYRWQRAVE